ncbi:hypothetical protein [Staphylococcus saprophyticus]|uniref:hypothetical protein n=1 Tax=Staphylococcus saprophyticus TaxID=29385 RepID=UPI0034C5FFA5
MKFKLNRNSNENVDKETKQMHAKWTKLRKKAKKRRSQIRSGRSRRHRPDILKTIFSDKDVRTRKSGRHALIYFILLFAAFFCLVMIINGGKNMYKDTVTNTSKIGTELLFPLSDSKVNLADVYTDKEHNLTVVRLAYGNEAHKSLPSDGENYDVLLKSKNKKDIKATYGLLGSNGDGYLFIKGDMGNQPFQIGLRNKLNLSTGKSNDGISEGSVPKADSVNNKSEMIDSITGTSEQSSNKNGIYDMFKDKSEKPKYDAVNFRINQHSKSTKVYNGSFLDENGEIKYGEVVKQMNVKSSVEKIDKQINNLEGKIETYDVSIKEYERKVKKDKHNAEAKADLNDAKDAKETTQKALEGQKRLKEQYNNYEFTKDSFEIMSQPDKTIYKPM